MFVAGTIWGTGRSSKSVFRMCRESREGGVPNTLMAPPFAIKSPNPIVGGSGFFSNLMQMGEVGGHLMLNSVVFMASNRYVEAYRFGTFRRENFVLKRLRITGKSAMKGDIPAELHRESGGIDQIYPNLQLIQLITMRLLCARPVKFDPLIEAGQHQCGLLVKSAPLLATDVPEHSSKEGYGDCGSDVCYVAKLFPAALWRGRWRGIFEVDIVIVGYATTFCAGAVCGGLVDRRRYWIAGGLILSAAAFNFFCVVFAAWLAACVSCSA